MQQCGLPASPPPFFFFFWSPAELGIRNWFPSPVAPQKAYHHYCRAEEREGRGSKIPDNYLSLVSRGLQEELKWGGEVWRGEAYQRDPCFFFRHANAPSFRSRGGRASQRWGLLGEEGRQRKKEKKMHHCVVSEQRFPFMRRQNCACVCLQIEMISSVEVLAEKLRHSAGARLPVQYCML